MKNAFLSFVKKYGALLLTVFILLSALLACFSIDSFAAFIREIWQVLLSEDHERISSYFSEFGFWSPLALIFFMVLQMFLIIFPSWLLMIIAVLVYGFWPGVVLSIAGVCLASSLGFLIGIKLNEATSGKIISKKKYEKMNYWVSHYGFWAVVLFRISLFLSNDAISFVVGMLSMNYRQFITATFGGVAPLAIAIAYFVRETATLETGMYWIGGLGLSGYAIYIYLFLKRKNA